MFQSAREGNGLIYAEENDEVELSAMSLCYVNKYTFINFNKKRNTVWIMEEKNGIKRVG